MDSVKGDDNFIDCNENNSLSILKGTAASILAIILFISFNELLPSIMAVLQNNKIDSYIYRYTIYTGYGSYFVYVVISVVLSLTGLFLNKKNSVFYTFFVLVIILNVYSFSRW